jgi:hypothetical protein
MSTPESAELHLEHLDQVADLLARQRRPYPPAVRSEAAAQLLRFTDRGLTLQKFGKEQYVTKKSRAHATPEPALFTGQGILFAVIDNREELEQGATTVDVIADAIEAALDAGHETSEDIARFITTSAFQHVPDKRIRYNSVLQANDSVGGYVTRKLMNAYNELAELAEEEEDPKKKADIAAEARGFAEAVQVVLSPFSCEDPADPRLVNWDEVDRITDAFIKEQRYVRKERKGNPQ